MPELAAGDVVLVPFPYTDLKSKKQRPAVVLSNAAFNQGPDAICCAMTSNLVDAAHSVLVDDSAMAEGALRATSRVKASKLATLKRDLVRKRVGRLKPAVLEQVMRELRTALG